MKCIVCGVETKNMTFCTKECYASHYRDHYFKYIKQRREYMVDYYLRYEEAVFRGDGVDKPQ